MGGQTRNSFSFIAPGDIKDPLAKNLDWRQSEVAGRIGGGNFRGYKLVADGDQRIVVKRLLASYAMAGLLFVVSIGLLVAAMALAVSGEIVPAVICALFGLPLVFLGFSNRKRVARDIALDRVVGVVGAYVDGEAEPSAPFPLQKVRAIQVLEPEMHVIGDGIGEREWFEFYLVLDDGRRAYLFSNGGDYQKIFRDAELLAAFLDVPVWGHFPKVIGAVRSVFAGVKAVIFGFIVLVSVGLVYAILNADMNGESIETPAQSFDLSPYDVDYSFDGNYETDFGYLQMRALRESTAAGALTTVVGRYATADGRFKGSAVLESPSQEFVISGIWVQSSSGEQCAEPMYGSRYWGSFRWVMTMDEDVVDPDVPGKMLLQLPFSGFTGQWRYCDLGTDDGGAGAGEWTGVRAMDLSLLNFCEVSVFALPEMERCPS